MTRFFGLLKGQSPETESDWEELIDDWDNITGYGLNARSQVLVKQGVRSAALRHRSKGVLGNCQPQPEDMIIPERDAVFAACATRPHSPTMTNSPIKELGIRDMNTTGIHHVAIICSDYERSKKFYVEVLGFSIIKETFREERNSYKLDLRVGANAQIELFSFPTPTQRASNPEACGLRHLAFAVDDLDQTVRELKSKGIEVEPVRLDSLTGKRFTFFKDPDCLPLEIYES